MTLLVVYTIAASILVPLSLIGGWFGVRWWWRRRGKRKHGKELDRLLEVDPADENSYS